MHVVVVGAGVIGASISKHLADKGVKVTVIEAAAVPATAATGKSWAWLNANYKQPRHYRDLNLRSMQLWQQQYRHLCHFCGSVMIHDERPVTDDQQDYDISQLTPAELKVLEPNLNPAVADSSHHARLFPQEGWCDPVQATRYFIQQAQQQGAQVMYNTQVVSFSTASSSKVTAVKCCSGTPSNTPQQQQQQSINAEAVVIAAGVGSPQLTSQLGYDLPLLHKPAAIVMTETLTVGLLQHMVITDSVFILQRSDGRCLIGETHPEEASNTDTSSSNAARILQLAAAAFPALNEAKVQGMYVGYRPYPADGYPVLGWLDDNSNVYVAVTHSGLTLAPLVGQLVAEEVTAALLHEGSSSSSSTRARSGATDTGLQSADVQELLRPYRPARSFNTTSASVRNWAQAMKQDKGIQRVQTIE